MTRRQDRKGKSSTAKVGPGAMTSSNNTKLGSRDATKISGKPDKGKGKAKAPLLANGKNGAPVSATANGQAAVEELDEAALLLREIQSLGGNDEDYAFLKDVDTDEELIENETVEDKKLAKELKSFMATLGDLGKAYADGEDDEEQATESDGELEGEDSEDEVSLDDDEESSVEGPAAESVEPVEAVKPTPTSQAASKPAPVGRSGMLVDPNPLWYESELPDLPSVSSDAPQPSNKTIEQLQARGVQLLTEISETFSGSLQNTGKADKLAMSSTLSSSDRTFISTILQSGTSSDKLSALILLSSSSPLHTTTLTKATK